MKNFNSDTPSGTFFAVYSDLSAAHLFTSFDCGSFMELVDMKYIPNVEWFIDAGYVWFFNVDDMYFRMAIGDYNEKLQH